MASEDTEDVCAPFNFSWVVENELAAMGCPGRPSNLRFLEKEGIKFLVTLSPENRPPIRTFPDLKWAEIPIEEFCPPSVSQIKTFIDICRKCQTEKEVSIYTGLFDFDINCNLSFSDHSVNYCCNSREQVQGGELCILIQEF
jgi:hypothetical protein